ncbi:interleukin-20 receptor subunit alpha [Pholidichthys leucotaenia]
MWTRLFFFSLLGLCCAGSGSTPSPMNINFSSVNLRNVLHWVPGNGTLNGTQFSVEYAIYGEKIQKNKGKRIHWRPVRHCTEIVRTYCDLSRETWDVDHGYITRVRALSKGTSSKWIWSEKRFDPKLDTSFGPPLVCVEIINNSIIITIKGPMRYQPNEHSSVVSMATLYPQMTYNLFVKNTHRNQTDRIPLDTNTYKYQPKEYDTKYCFSAQSRFLSLPISCQSSAWHCITTPQDPVIVQLRSVIVGIVVPSLCICAIVVAGYLLYRYLSVKEEKSPNILRLPGFSPPPLTIPPEKTNLTEISLVKEEIAQLLPSLSAPACPTCQPHLADPPPSYSLQGPGPPSESSEHEDPIDDSFSDYGSVRVVPQIGAEVNECPSGEFYAPQARSHMAIQPRAQLEMSTSMQAHGWAPVDSAVQTLTFQNSPIARVVRNDGKRQPGALFLSKTPQSGPSLVPLNIQTHRGEENGRANPVSEGTLDVGVEGENKPENVPLLSAYASQNIRNMSTSHSDTIGDDYGVLRLAPEQEAEVDYYGDDDDGEDSPLSFDWETTRLELSQMRMRLNTSGGEDSFVMKGGLRLEDVFVKQSSLEEVHREPENEEDMSSEVDNVLNQWELVISMDQ